MCAAHCSPLTKHWPDVSRLPAAGEVVGEIACVDTLEACLTGPVLLRHFSTLLQQAQLLILDANLSAGALQVSPQRHRLPQHAICQLSAAQRAG